MSSQVRDRRGILTDVEHRNERLKDIAIGILLVLAAEGVLVFLAFVRAI